MNKLTSLMVLGSVAVSLTSCSATKEQFDFSKKAPDEFAIITRAPLEMPTNSALPLPRPGIARPQETSPEKEAKQALFGVPAEQPTTLTSGESVLLQKTGAAQTNPNIRATIDKEAVETIKENTSTFNKIMGKAGKKIDVPVTVVDPIKEHERILQNKKAGKPITDGETPSIEQ